MGKNPKTYDWPDAQRICRLNDDDIEMAKRLGFRPEVLVRSRPGPREGWKLPVKEWVHELHLERFGNVLGSNRTPPPPLEYDAEAARAYGEQMYWEDHHERNSEETPGKKQRSRAIPRPDGSTFVPIGLHTWIEMMVKKGDSRKETTVRLKGALARYRAGARCRCGRPIWVIGSSILGNTCFPCATFESDSSQDYELAEAFDKAVLKRVATQARRLGKSSVVC